MRAENPEKESAIFGLCNLLLAKPDELMKYYVIFCDVVLSITPSQALAAQMFQTLHWPRNALPADWPRIYATVNPRVKQVKCRYN